MSTSRGAPARRRLLSCVIGLACAVAGLGAWAQPAAAAPAPARFAAAAGASLPYVEQQAEDAATNGTKIGPDRTFTHLPSEASGRKAVTLDAKGEYVEFTTGRAANSLVLRYSLPDSADGQGSTAPIGLYVGGAKVKDLQLTSRYAWYYGSYPFTNRPGDGTPHHFYDEVHTLLPDMPSGTKVRLQVDASTATPYTIDLADFQQVGAAGTQPANSVSVTDHGADPTGAQDASGAFDAAIAAAKSSGRSVWIPKGTFKVTRHIIVDDVTIKGAGPWYSTVTGKGVGFYGRYVSDAPAGGSRNVHLSDFAIFGDTTERNDNDQVNGVGGALGDSTVDNLWIEHTKCAFWLDGPFDGLKITNTWMRNLTADGLNFHKGVTNSSVADSHVRNTGDDGLAMWSEQQADSGNSFSGNTVELPILANNIAIYGGRDNTVSDNLVKDTLTQGGGIHVANRFAAVPVSGTTTVSGNRLERTGVLDPNWQFGVGAIWFDARDGAMNGTIKVTDTEIVDSSYEAIHFIDSTITGVSFKNVKITGAGTFAVQLQANGSASFENVTATGIGKAGVYSCLGNGAFTLTKDAASTGWSSSYCGPWPDPVYGGDNGGGDPGDPGDPTGGNLAEGRPATATSQTEVYAPGRAVDGDANSYWESADNAFPQSLTVDLGSAQPLRRAVLKLPPQAAWGARTQTLSVQGSTDGSSFAELAASKGYRFDPASGNTVTVSLPGTSTRYLRLHVTGNTGWPAAQVSEVEAYNS